MEEGTISGRKKISLNFDCGAYKLPINLLLKIALQQAAVPLLAGFPVGIPRLEFQSIYNSHANPTACGGEYTRYGRSKSKSRSFLYSITGETIL